MVDQSSDTLRIAPKCFAALNAVVAEIIRPPIEVIVVKRTIKRRDFFALFDWGFSENPASVKFCSFDDRFTVVQSLAFSTFQ
jgi:hypothetical protein